MPASAKGDDCEQLLEELRDLLSVRLALILIPVRQALQVAGRQELAAAIETITGNLAAELRSILSNYQVLEKDRN